ncbi:MAG: phosphate/phosphite/phosphonate ABC transporter substrate-binding protein [Oscillochloridaceae bacterium umkhey_bin13]
MYNLMVCPHDTVRSAEGWYRTVQYLNDKLGLDLHFELAMDFAEFHANLAKADLAYLNPKDCYTLRKNSGFVPVLRPTDTYDETLIVAGADDASSTLSSLAGAKIATIPTMLQSKLGLKLLSSHGVAPGEMVACDSWLGVVRSVWGGDAPYGMIYRDAYEELSPQGKGMVRVLATSDEQIAFHCISVGPKLADKQDAIAAAFLAMPNDPLGKEVLADIHLPGWIAVSDAELDKMAALIEA